MVKWKLSFNQLTWVGITTFIIVLLSGGPGPQYGLAGLTGYSFVALLFVYTIGIVVVNVRAAFWGAIGLAN